MPEPGVPSGDARKLNPPPKFGNVDTGGSPAPKTIADWVAFFRWLFNVWRVASVSIDVPESISFTRPPVPQGASEETLGAAQAFEQRLPPRTVEVGPWAGSPRQLEPRGEVDLGEVRAKQAYRSVGRPDELTALVASALGRQRSPQPIPQGTNVIEAPHAYRSLLVTVNVTAGAVARTAGGFFFADMVGKQVALFVGTYTLYTVLTYIDPSNITIDPSVTTAAAPLFFQYYPSVEEAEGTFFWETDRTLLYLSVAEIGTVTTAGTAVAWDSGAFFNPYWKGKLITINGLVYPIADVAGPTAMTLGTSAGVQPVGVAYSVESGAWQYVAGQYFATLANIPVLGMSTRDTGVLFEASDYKHMYRWSGTAWDYAPGDPGSAYLVATQGSAPAGGLWGLCDGSTYTRSTPLGATTSFVTRDLTNGDFLKVGNATHAAAVAPTFTGNTGSTTATFASGAETEAEDVHTHSVTIATDTTSAGAGAPVVYGLGGGYSTGPGTSHLHDITNASAPQNAHSHAISSATAPINTDGRPPSVGLDFYVRL